MSLLHTQWPRVLATGREGRKRGDLTVERKAVSVNDVHKLQQNMKSVHRHVEMFDRIYQITNSIILVLVGHPRSAYQTQLHSHQFELDFVRFNMFVFFVF